MILKEQKNNPETPELIIVDSEQPKRLQYVGVDAQYFTSAVLASSDADAPSVILKKLDARALSEPDEMRPSRTPVTFRAESTTRSGTGQRDDDA